jgi:hypothetical protein
MNQKYSLKDKVNGQWRTFGNINPGERGPRVGLRVTPELREMVNAKQDGEWLNFLAFPDDGQQRAGGGGQGYGSAPQPSGYGQQRASTAPALPDDEIPF